MINLETAIQYLTFSGEPWREEISISHGDYSLQIQDHETLLWRHTDRVFPGEKYRIVRIMPPPLVDAKSLRHWYELDKKWGKT